MHLVRTDLQDPLADTIADVTMPVPILRGRDDRLLTRRWTQQLADGVAEATVLEVPGAHTSPRLDPEAWSLPVRELALRVGR